MMKNIKAYLIDWNKIKILNLDVSEFDFFINGNCVKLINENNDEYSFSYDGEILGNDLYLLFNNKKIVVSVLECPKFDDFDDKYYYAGNDLGSTYYKKYTDFVLWAPLAKKVILHLNDDEYELRRFDNGIYKARVNGNFSGCLYDYEVFIDDYKVNSIDPYGKSSNANAQKSAIIDFKKTRINTNSKHLKEFDEYVEAIIYEGHIRDLTIHKNSDIVKKGKFLGLIEKNKKTNKGNPIGLDYIKSLGITHLQLLPVLDYGSVDETKDNEYNWGYDPVQFFALEGSYSTIPNDPYSRIIEFKKLISIFHKNNIRINLDVVYNHVYKINQFSLNKITPNYFFRFENGALANHSWCGNDFATERLMARKIIIDSIMFLLKEYDVDGFRFDLMGLIDVQTMNEISEKVHKIKPNAMIYGEGWDMFATSKYCKDFSHMKNAHLLKNIAFFNDSYRNIIRGVGSKSELEETGFLLGNKDFESGFPFAYFAGTKDCVFPKLFASYNQSINYVECHDNATLFDVINDSTNIDEKFRIIKLFNKFLLLTPGIPFIHMGQEFGQSKNSYSNTYNKGDKYNAFNIDLYDKNIDLVESFKNYIKLRKSIDLFNESDSNVINSKISIERIENGFDIILNTENIYHLMINKDDNFLQLSDLKYKKMELFYPETSRDGKEKLTAYSLGLGPKKCSIYKEF